jgi:type IV secretion system protein VirD4
VARVLRDRLAFIAGYRLKAFLIAQSLNQLEKAYGVNNAILDNCHVRVAYGANDDRTARRISDLLGQTTEKKTQKSFSGSGLWLSNRTESEQEYGRPLLTAGEVTQLPPDDGILLVGGLLPYRARKVRYFLDRRFRDRAGQPPPDSAQEQARELLARVPSAWDGLIVGAITADAVAAPSSSNVAALDGGDHAAVPPAASLPVAAEDVWEGFFASQSPLASAQADDVSDSSTPEPP